MSDIAPAARGSFGTPMDSFEHPAAVHGNLNPSGESGLSYPERLAAVSPLAAAEYNVAAKRARNHHAATNAFFAEQAEKREAVQKAGLHVSAAQNDPSMKPRDVARLEKALAAAQAELKDCKLESAPGRQQLYEEFKPVFVQGRYANVGTTDSRPSGATSDEDALEYRVGEWENNKAMIANLQAEACTRPELETCIDEAIDSLRRGSRVSIDERNGKVTLPRRAEWIGTTPRDVIDVPAILADLLAPELKAAFKARIRTAPGKGMTSNERAATMATLTAERESILYRVAFWVRKIEAKSDRALDLKGIQLRAEHYLDLKRVR